jgi:hypothetical protein
LNLSAVAVQGDDEILRHEQISRRSSFLLFLRPAMRDGEVMMNNTHNSYSEQYLKQFGFNDTPTNKQEQK